MTDGSKGQESLPITFRQFEHSGWQTVAGGYHDYFANLTKQAITPMLDLLHLAPGMQALDIAAGPGYVGGSMIERGIRVTAVDFSSEMVELTRSSYAEIKALEADAEELPFVDESFDRAAMNFGILHLSNPEKAVSEAWRVLKVSGRFAFSVWSEPEEAVGFKIVLDAVQKRGNQQVPLPPGPPFFQFSREEASMALMKEAGFAEVSCQKVSMCWKLMSPDQFFSAFYTGTPRTGGLLRAQTAADLQAIKDEIHAGLTPYMVNNRLEVPMSCLISCGTKYSSRLPTSIA